MTLSKKAHMHRTNDSSIFEVIRVTLGHIVYYDAAHTQIKRITLLRRTSGARFWHSLYAGQQFCFVMLRFLFANTVLRGPTMNGI